MVEAGRQYYFIIHAYHHVIAEVIEVLGRRHVDAKKVAWIYSCKRGWDLFFKDGAKEDTTFRAFPDGDFVYQAAFEWKHPIPGHKE